VPVVRPATMTRARRARAADSSAFRALVGSGCAFGRTCGGFITLRERHGAVSYFLSAQPALEIRLERPGRHANRPTPDFAACVRAQTLGFEDSSGP